MKNTFSEVQVFDLAIQVGADPSPVSHAAKGNAAVKQFRPVSRIRVSLIRVSLIRVSLYLLHFRRLDGRAVIRQDAQDSRRSNPSRIFVLSGAACFVICHLSFVICHLSFVCQSSVWLRVICRAKLMKIELLDDLIDENQLLCRFLNASLKKAKRTQLAQLHIRPRTQ